MVHLTPTTPVPAVFLKVWSVCLSVLLSKGSAVCFPPGVGVQCNLVGWTVMSVGLCVAVTRGLARVDDPAAALPVGPASGTHPLQEEDWDEEHC